VTIYLWDASDYDWDRGSMDLASARAAGIDGFTHKATEATTTKHVHYGEAMRRARDAGIPFLGAYHVVRSPANAAAEVDYCLAYVNAQTPWWKDFPGWFWQIDLERWPYDAVPASEGEGFADIIEERTGRRAIIYASRTQYGNQLAGTSHPLWNANYGNNSAGEFKALYAARGGDTGAGWAPYSGTTPAIWQYGSQARIGRQNTCDANAYRGTTSDFARLIGRPSAANGEQEMELTTVVPGTKTSTVGADRPFGTAFADLYITLRATLEGEHDPRPGTPLAGLVALAKGASQLLAATAADEQRDNAALAAITALAALIQQAGGNVDAAPIIAAVKAVGDDTHTIVTTLAQQRDDLLQRCAALQAELDEVKASVDAQLSPAERAALGGATAH
jgi:GH25 family lysozyme M1 (1,4-beta-N-acetylmuramidase)